MFGRPTGRKFGRHWQKQLIPKELDGEALRTGIIEVVGPKTILQFRMNIRYSEDVELWETPSYQE